MKNEEYKKLSISEFTKAAGRYESNHAGIYEMCKKDYPDILEELEKEPFNDLLDAGCGPAPMISLLSEKSLGQQVGSYLGYVKIREQLYCSEMVYTGGNGIMGTGICFDIYIYSSNSIWDKN